ncbi:hypothetical protein BH09ACT13_BH09ACT13_10370 [soil metagenome]
MRYTVSERVIEQRQIAPLKHGARSERQIAPVARAHKRRMLRQSGLRAGDLDGVGNALLDNWSRAQAKVSLLDDFFNVHGLVDEHGEPQPAARLYFTGLNSARLALARFSEHMSRRTPSRDALSDYVIEAYGNGDEN